MHDCQDEEEEDGDDGEETCKAGTLSIVRAQAGAAADEFGVTMTHTWTAASWSDDALAEDTATEAVIEAPWIAAIMALLHARQQALLAIMRGDHVREDATTEKPSRRSTVTFGDSCDVNSHAGPSPASTSDGSPKTASATAHHLRSRNASEMLTPHSRRRSRTLSAMSPTGRRRIRPKSISMDIATSERVLDADAAAHSSAGGLHDSQEPGGGGGGGGGGGQSAAPRFATKSVTLNVPKASECSEGGSGDDGGSASAPDMRSHASGNVVGKTPSGIMHDGHGAHDRGTEAVSLDNMPRRSSGHDSRRRLGSPRRRKSMSLNVGGSCVTRVTVRNSVGDASSASPGSEGSPGNPRVCTGAASAEPDLGGAEAAADGLDASEAAGDGHTSHLARRRRRRVRRASPRQSFNANVYLMNKGESRLVSKLVKTVHAGREAVAKRAIASLVVEEQRARVAAMVFERIRDHRATIPSLVSDAASGSDEVVNGDGGGGGGIGSSSDVSTGSTGAWDSDGDSQRSNGDPDSDTHRRL